jgi:hypothetical protein
MTMSAGSEVQLDREFDRREWAPFFEDMNRRIEDGAQLEVTLEIVSEEQVGPEAERLPLIGITYEDGDDEIAIGLGGRGRRFPAVLWHFAEHPRQVWAHEEGGQLSAMAFKSEDGTLTLLRLYTSD